MKIFNGLNELELVVSKETEEMIVFEPFMLVNPSTPNFFPEDDEPYYTSLEMQLRHLLYKYSEGWITSERQVMLSSDECISTVHFLFGENDEVDRINVFQRSSNVLNLIDDVQFFNYFIAKYIKKPVELSIFVSCPHSFKNKTKKVESVSEVKTELFS